MCLRDILGERGPEPSRASLTPRGARRCPCPEAIKAQDKRDYARVLATMSSQLYKTNRVLRAVAGATKLFSCPRLAIAFALLTNPQQSWRQVDSLLAHAP